MVDNKNEDKSIYVGQPSPYKFKNALSDANGGRDAAQESSERHLEAMLDAAGVLEASMEEDIALEGEVLTEEDVAPMPSPPSVDLVRATDPSLSECEKRLSKQQLDFCVHYARTQNGGQSAIAAGYAKASARVSASKLLRNKDVAAVIRSRMPMEKRLEGLSKDWILDRLVNIANRSLQDCPVMGNDGKPSGYYAYDAMTALKALDQIAGIMGVKKDSLELSAKPGEVEKPEGREVKMGIISIADRIKKDGLKKKIFQNGGSK